MVPVVHPYGSNVATKSICVFVASEEERKAAIEAGAANAGGADLVQEIMKGRVEIVSGGFIFFCSNRSI